MRHEERLFALMGNLPDAMLEEAALAAPKPRRWRLPALAAACLALAVCAGVFALSQSGKSDTLTGPDPVLSQPGTEPPPGEVITWAVPVQNGGGSTTAYTNNALHCSHLPMGGRIAEYHEIYPGELPDARRPQFVGEFYEELENWYRPADSASLQYLLHREEDGFTLWEFAYFLVWDEESLTAVKEGIDSGESLWAQIPWFSLDLDCSPYSYREVMETVYGVFGPEDLVSLTVSPANMDNTDAGKALQAEIGERTVTDRDALDALYSALAGMTCYGANHWDLIDKGDYDISDGLLESVRLCRYLTLETAAGAVIGSLKYAAAGGQFYEYSGVAYAPLDGETAAEISRIVGIDP